MNATMLTGLGENTVGPGLEKAPAGIRGLNQIIGGGLPRGRVSLVAGAGAGQARCASAARSPTPRRTG